MRPFSFWKSANTFDPSTLSLMGWWRANYASLPWGGTPSAGSSATNSFTNVGDTAPATGTAVNGYTPASFNGTDMGAAFASATSDLVSTGAGSIFALAKVASAAASSGTAFGDPAVWGDEGGQLCLSFSTGGVGYGIYDGVQKRVQVACSTGAWHLLQMKWDGTNVFGRVDSGSWSSTAAGSVGSLASNSAVGKQPFVAFLGFDLLEIGFAQTALADATFDQIRTYANSRYSLAL